ncbi:uncharacterized protein LOC143233453 isoform X3 [Tachypleus tridentatus]|uniref:uncharacterized protein LOC143233453 isoform X3 n=1 Tax=Tachypleus tridentatus TaxID=6853 RepID=UPI003FD4AAC5
MFPYTPPAESPRFNIAYLGMIPQCLLIQNLLEGLKKVHSRCALLILGRLTIFNLYLSEGSSRLQCISWSPSIPNVPA